MAAIASRKSNSKDKNSIFWAKIASKKLDSHVPGVTMQDKGNLRPKVKGGRVAEVKAAVPFVQPETGVEEEKEDVDDEDDEFLDSNIVTSAAASEVTQSILDTDVSTVTTIHNNKKVSLRDLCVEDKKRVANLIKELAKLGEEKESAEKNLEEERRRYEEQILQLVDQQEEILKEREEVQKRMLEYQTYILSLKQKQKEAELRQVQRAAHKAKIPLSAEKQSGSRKHKQPGEFHTRNEDKLTQEDGCHEEENLCDENVEEPSQHFYLNDLDEGEENTINKTGDATVSRLDNLSTCVQPAVSPQPIRLVAKTASRERKNSNPNLGQSPRPDRPFTTLIDRELENQQRILDVAMNNSSNRQLDKRGGKSVQDLFQDPPEKQERVAETGNSLISGNLNTHKGIPSSQPQIFASSMDKNVDGAKDDNKIIESKKYSKAGTKKHADPRVIDLPHGNLSLLTLEKNELLSLFMESHAEIQHTNGHTMYQQGTKIVEPAVYSHGTDVQPVRDGGGFGNDGRTSKRQGDQFVDDDEENIIPVKDIGHQKASAKSTSQHHSNKLDNGHNHNNHHRRKQRRPPPPSYGPLHPPVMSSTQKSNEIADFVSVTSTEVSAPDHRRNVNIPRASSPNDVERAEGNGGFREKGGRIPGKAVEFSENKDDGKRETVLPQEEDFLEKYRKMSPSERKRELLKQKSMLQEEQARLKTILADQETQLQQKQQEAMSKMEQFEEMRAGDDSQVGEMQASLMRLEEDLARKEQEMIQGRELLRQKKQTQARLQSEADDAFLGDKSPYKQEAKCDVLSSTPLKDVQMFPQSSPTDEQAETGRKLSGTDGDGCVLYGSLPPGGVGGGGDGDNKPEGRIVQQLDFPPDSENEAENLVYKKNIETPSRVRDEKDEQREVEDADPVNGNKVDAGTSISYANLPRTINGQEPKQEKAKSKARHSPRKEGCVRKKTSGRHSVSPGEKTLSVLEIINSLDDDVTAVTTSRPVTKDNALSSRHLPHQTGISSVFDSQNIWPLQGSSQLGKGSEMPQASAEHTRFGLGLHSRQIPSVFSSISSAVQHGKIDQGLKMSQTQNSHTQFGLGPHSRQIPTVLSGISSDVKLGGTGGFGQGFYSASRVVSGMTNSGLGYQDHLGTASGLLASAGGRDRNRFPQNRKMPEVLKPSERERFPQNKKKLENVRPSERERFPQNGRLGVLKPPEREMDENLDVFELKRISGKDSARPKEDEDMIDLILSRGGYGIGDDDDNDEAASIDLSAVCYDDDDADSNLDDIVRAIGDEEECELDQDVEDMYKDRNRKTKSRRRNSSTDLSDDDVEMNNFNDDNMDENGLLAMLVKNMDLEDDNNSIGREMNVKDYGDEEDNVLDDDVEDLYNEGSSSELNEAEDLEESQILEDIFFVQ